ncbi:MAG: CD1247 N-terminal domain-containing protein [Bacillota bacterium]
MKELQQKISYLQGLAEGLDLEKSSEGKVIAGILDVLDDLADYVAYLKDDQDDLADYVKGMDSDLSDLEDDFYLEDDDLLEDDLVDVTCPECGEDVLFDEDIIYTDDLVEVVCPACGAVVFVNDEQDDELLCDATSEDEADDSE